MLATRRPSVAKVVLQSDWSAAHNNIYFHERIGFAQLLKLKKLPARPPSSLVARCENNLVRDILERLFCSGGVTVT